MPAFYYIGSAIMKMLLRLLTRYRVAGKENVPAEGPLLVVANHLHLADPPLLCAAIPRDITFMAKEEVFTSLWQGPLARGYGAFSVRKGTIDRRAVRRALQVLADGKALGMFPEGSRSRSAQMQPAYQGTAFIAHHSAATILPVGITGTEQFRRAGWVLRRPRIIVTIGRPFRLPEITGKLDEASLEQMTCTIMGHISALLPESYRGVYGGRTEAQVPSPEPAAASEEGRRAS